MGGYGMAEVEVRANLAVAKHQFDQPWPCRPRLSVLSSCVPSAPDVLQAFLDVQVHPDRLRLGEIVDRRRAMFAAKAGIAHAAPGQPDVGIAVGVDPDRAGIRFLGEALHPSDVAAPDACGEAVGGAVVESQRVGLVVGIYDTHPPTEDFLQRGTHLIFGNFDNSTAAAVSTSTHESGYGELQCLFH